jgi:hypothetical protein
MARSGRRGDHDHDHDYDDERKREHSDRRDRDFPVFLRIRGARWLGSMPPSAEAYARALAQWRQLPGAIGVTTTDLGGATEPEHERHSLDSRRSEPDCGRFERG